VTRLLELNREKRAKLGDLQNHPWFHDRFPTIQWESFSVKTPNDHIKEDSLSSKSFRQEEEEEEEESSKGAYVRG
jgi:hypothetical protein